jgi:hypothetical protein
MTVRQALAQKRLERKGNVEALVLCKAELFYMPSPSPCTPDDTVYPVRRAAAEAEARWFGVPFSEE